MILELKSNLLFLVRVFAVFSLCSAIFIMHHLVVIPVGSLHLPDAGMNHYSAMG